ncbi:hypothetical protein SLS62_003037 [Diatrype stigma]|uniref:Uncharacterized protein n=1 Tax=Diatrype stigma TaxID=117547 RepID=A0AAN9YQ83_9PEZI
MAGAIQTYMSKHAVEYPMANHTSDVLLVHPTRFRRDDPSETTVTIQIQVSPIPKVPPAIEEVVCNDESDFPEHGDIDPETQKDYSEDFCLNFRDKPGQIGPYTTSVEYTYDSFNLFRGSTWYHFSVRWVPGCNLGTDTSQNMTWPVGGEGNEGLSCPEIMKNNYIKCNNGGVGGKTKAGCLSYTFKGT